MTGPIISPFWIYLIQIASVFNTIVTTVTIVAGVITLFTLISWFATAVEGDDTYDCKKAALRMTIISICFACLSAFIPSRDTMIGMFAAQMISYENVDAIGDTAKESVDYIIDQIDKLLEDGTSGKEGRE